MAANLYSGGIITIGTLIAVFLATSDEAILIIMGNPEHAGKIGILLLAKVIIAIVAGYLVDIFFKKEIAVPHHEGELCHDCGCHNHSSGIVKPALRHTGKIFLYLFVFTFILNLCIEVLGIDRISAMMLGDTVFQILRNGDPQRLARLAWLPERSQHEQQVHHSHHHGDRKSVV